MANLSATEVTRGFQRTTTMFSEITANGPVTNQPLVFNSLPASQSYEQTAQGVTTLRGPNESRWQAMKGVLYYLYMFQNLNLRDTMDIVARKYQFKASDKMYKRRFRKWEWHKYSSLRTRLAGCSIKASDHAKSCTRRRNAKLSRAVSQGFLQSLSNVNDISRLVEDMMRHIRDYHSRYINREIPIQHRHRESPTLISATLVDVLDMLENPRTVAEGGILLREIFIDVEAVIISSDVLHLLEVFGTIPRLLLTGGHKEILRIFLNHCDARLGMIPGEDQLQAIIASMRELYILDLKSFDNWLCIWHEVWAGERLLQLKQKIEEKETLLVQEERKLLEMGGFSWRRA